MGVIGDGVLEVAAISAASAYTTALRKERDEADRMARGIRAIERGDVVEQRGLAVNGFGDFVFGVAAEDDVLLLIHGDDGSGANLETGDQGVGAGAFRGVSARKICARSAASRTSASDSDVSRHGLVAGCVEADNRRE